MSAALVVSLEDITSDLDHPVCGVCGQPSVAELAWDLAGAERQGTCVEHLWSLMEKAFVVAAHSFLPPSIHPINPKAAA